MSDHLTEENAASDTIPLTRYWNIIIQHWWIVVLAVLLSILGSYFIERYRVPHPYPYATVIQVGQGPDQKPLESSSTIMARLSNVYIPKALTEYATSHGYDEQQYTVEVEIPVDSSVVILRSEDKQESKEDLLTLHSNIANLMIADHQRLFELIQKSLTLDKAQAQRVLDFLQEQARLFPERFRRIDDSVLYIQKQLSELESGIQNAQKNRAIILTSESQRPASDESLATTLLLIDSDIDKQRAKKAELEQRLSVDIKKQKDELEQQRIDNKLEQTKAQKIIDSVQLQIDSISATKKIIEPSQFLRLPQQSPYRNLLLSSVLGLLLGGMLTFFIDFVKRANAERALR